MENLYCFVLVLVILSLLLVLGELLSELQLMVLLMLLLVLVLVLVASLRSIRLSERLLTFHSNQFQIQNSYFSGDFPWKRSTNFLSVKSGKTISHYLQKQYIL